MKTTITRVKKLSEMSYAAEICDDETKEVLIVGVGPTEDAARKDAAANWKTTVEQLSR